MLQTQMNWTFGEEYYPLTIKPSDDIEKFLSAIVTAVSSEYLR